MKNYNKIITIIIIIGLLIYPGFTLIGRVFGLRTYIYKTDDMSPTIQSGDKIIIYNRAYRHKEPKVGEIVALILPDNIKKIYVRRIVQKNNGNAFYVSADNKDGIDSKKWGNIPAFDIIGETIFVYRGHKCIYNKLLNKQRKPRWS
ncbi:MAG: S26 family signal peptidase [Candidatus Omnitrophica bacterium]|nr:S26 family signal peptidase [Candidatus Omnitrophota bacterium]